MTYALITDGELSKYPASVADLKKANPNTSFPRNPKSFDHEAWGLYEVVEAAVPAINPELSRVVTNPPIDIDGVWTVTYTVEDLTDEERAAISEGKAAYIRQERDQKLQESDWTQVPDAPVDQVAWADYRAQLRLITEQPRFPDKVTWPVEPS